MFELRAAAWGSGDWATAAIGGLIDLCGAAALSQTDGACTGGER